LLLKYKLVALIALVLQSECDLNIYYSNGLVVVTTISSPCTLTVLVVIAVYYVASLVYFSISAI